MKMRSFVFAAALLIAASQVVYAQDDKTNVDTSEVKTAVQAPAEPAEARPEEAAATTEAGKECCDGQKQEEAQPAETAETAKPVTEKAE